MASLLTLFCEGSQLLYLPVALFTMAGQGAWFALLLGNAAASLVGLLGIVVGQRFPGLMPAQIARQVLGKWLGGLVGFLYGAFFVWVYALALRDLVDFSQIVLLPETPAWVLTLLVALPVLYMAWEGLEPVARVAFALVVAKVAAVLLIPLMVSKEFSVMQVEPLLYHGFGSVLRSSAAVLPWSVESLVVMSMAPNLRPGARASRWFLLGMGGATLLLLVLIVSTSLVFGPDLAGRFTYPVYTMVQMVMVGRTIERIEMVPVSIWLFGILLKLTICLYAAASAWSNALGGDRRYRKMAVLATAVGALMTALWSGPMDVMTMTQTRVWTITTVAFAFSWPLLLLVASFLRRPRQEPGDLHV